MSKTKENVTLKRWFMSYVWNTSLGAKALAMHRHLIVGRHPFLVISEWNQKPDQPGDYFVLTFYRELQADEPDLKG